MTTKVSTRELVDHKDCNAHKTDVVGPIIAVAVAAADLLERDELDLDVVLLLEGEEEVVRITVMPVHGLCSLNLNLERRTVQASRKQWPDILIKLVSGPKPLSK